MIHIIICVVLGALVGFTLCLNIWVYLECKKLDKEIEELENYLK